MNETVNNVDAGILPVAEFLRHLHVLGIEFTAREDKLALSAPAGVLTTEIQGDLRHRKTEILEYLKARDAGGEVRIAPLSFAQQRLWLIERFAAKSAAYNIPQSWHVESAIDFEAFRVAVQRLAERHETLRTRIDLRQGEPVQVVMRQVETQTRFSDLSHLEEQAQEKELKTTLMIEGLEHFDLTRAPFIRFHLFKMGEGHSVVSFVVHHIVADQWSLGVLKRDLASLYLEIANGEALHLPVLAMQYADVAEAEHGEKAARVHAEQLEYWRDRLKGVAGQIDLPFAKPRPATQTFAGSTFAVTIDSTLTSQLRELAGKCGTTLYVLMLAAYGVLIHRYTGEEDLCIGTPITGRSLREEEELIGLFVNLLPLRCSVTGAKSVAETVRRVGSDILLDFEKSALPFQKLVTELHTHRSPAYSPLFQLMFALNPKGVGDETAQDETFLGYSKFDLTLQIAERVETLDAYFEYRTELFEERDIARFAEHFVQLIRSVVNTPDDPIDSLDILTREDVDQFTAWNTTDLEFDRTRTLVDLFEAQAKSVPDAIAICCGSEELSYRELHARVNHIAGLLVERGAGTGMFVGICLERSIDLIVSILGVLKCGAAYLPLDPKYPKDRLRYMLEDSGAGILIAQDSASGEKLSSGLHEISIVIPRDVFESFSNRSVASDYVAAQNARPNDAAYLIYTSGSTGKPKGVVVEHRNAVSLIEWARSHFDVEAIHGMLACTSVCFDLSIFEMFLPLSTGNTMIVMNDVLELASSPLAGRVTLINTVPSAVSALLEAGLPSSATTVCLAGEFLPTELVDRLYASGVKRVYDLYGPTETTTYSTCVLRQAGALATIGKPILNTRVYLLNDSLRPVPPGVAGEVFIGGEGVTRGYLNRPELTAEKFLSVGNVERIGRLYRTGDLARQLPDGSLVYLGRRDHQIKLRGFRIELGEVEAALRDASGVSQAAVVVQKSDVGDTLVGFFAGGEDWTSDRLKEITLRMQGRLPGYMVPAFVIPIASMPLTPNGKIDRKALSARLITRDIANPGSSLKASAPRDLLEQWLANIWARRLGRAQIAREGHFFEQLGGHSLAAFEMFSEIEARIGVALMLATLFQAPTVAALAVVIRRQRWKEPKWIRFIAPGRNEGQPGRVIYSMISREKAPVGEIRDSADRFMEVSAVDGRGLSWIDDCVKEIVALEATTPTLILEAITAQADIAEALRGSLLRAGMRSVSIRLR